MKFINKTIQSEMNFIKNIIISLLFGGIYQVSFAQEIAYPKLITQLKRYSIQRENWSPDLIPILMGNAEIGGLADPLGRGFYNLSLTDCWLDSLRRIAAPGFMLKFNGLEGIIPSEYHQVLDLTNGLLKTKALFNKEGYSTEMFFSRENKHLLCMKVTNLGQKELRTSIQTDFSGYRISCPDDSTIQATTAQQRFTRLSWALSSTVPLRTYFSELPKKGTQGIIAEGPKDLVFTLQPGAFAVFNFATTTHWDGDSFGEQAQNAVKSDKFENNLFQNNLAWEKDWRNTATIILPQGKYAEVFYRSLFWLYCTAGSDHFLPGEVQFADLSVPMANDYQYKISHEVHTNWWEHPFTYGAAGWSAMAFTMLGNKEKAGKILDWMYQPEEYKNNVTQVFPVGAKDITARKKKYGLHNYLANENLNAFYLGHELMLTGRNINVFPYDWQAHIQAFGASLFHTYRLFYGEDNTGRKAYDVLKGTAEFWSEMLRVNPNTGKCELPPMNSLSEDLFNANLLDCLLAAKWNLKIASRYAKMKNEHNFVQKWSSLDGRIEIPQNKQFFLEYTGDTINRNGGGYFGVRGFVYLAFPTVELIKDFNADKVNRTLDVTWQRNRYGDGMITFVANWFALADAYMHMGDKALEKSSYCLGALDKSETAMMEVPGKRPYYLDSYASFTVVPVSMLVQSIDNHIETFPAVPSSWKDISFYDIPALDDIRVSGEMKDGKILWTSYSKGGNLILKVDGKSTVKVIRSSNGPYLKLVK